MAAKVSYIIKLVDAFNRTFSGVTQARRDKLRPLLSDFSVRIAIGAAAVKEIKKRAERQIDKKGGNMAPLSAAYAKFKRSKGKGSKANLRFTGAMLKNMEPESRPSGKNIIIAFDDQLQNDKAHGHITGRRGKVAKKRDFLGLPSSVETAIIRSVIVAASRTALVEGLELE